MRRLALASSMAIAATLAMLLAGGAEARAVKPRAPPGRDPGGIAVAIIGRGIDYTRPDIAPSLARDGEGEPIAWDFADDDARPLASADGGDTAAAIALLGEAGMARLVVMRTPAGNPATLAAALQLVAQTPARVVLLVPEVAGPIPLRHLTEAARRLPGLLLMVPEALVDERPATPVPGLVLVASSPSATDTEVSRTAAATTDSAGAAARAAGRAARLLSREPLLTPAELQARLAAAGPPAAGPRDASGR